MIGFIFINGSDHDTEVIRGWLGQFITEPHNEDSFYIYLNKLEDIIEVSVLIGQDIKVGTFLDEPCLSI